MLQGQAGALVPEESQRAGRDGLGTKGGSNHCHSCARRRAGSALPARCAWETPQMLSKAHDYLKTTLKHTFSAKSQRLWGNQRALRFPTGRLRQSCVAGVMFTQKMTTATTLGFF